MVRQSKRVALLGALLGFVAYLIYVVPASLYFGRRAGHMLADGLLGNPLPETFSAHALVLFGLVLVVFAIVAIFIVGGAFIASMVSLILGGKGDDAAPTGHH